MAAASVEFLKKYWFGELGGHLASIIGPDWIGMLMASQSSPCHTNDARFLVKSSDTIIYYTYISIAFYTHKWQYIK